MLAKKLRSCVATLVLLILAGCAGGNQPAAGTQNPPQDGGEGGGSGVGGTGAILVSAPGDDWQIWDQPWQWTSADIGATAGDVSFGRFNGVREWCGFRFTPPNAIPAGATITTASLELYTQNILSVHGFFYVTESADVGTVESGSPARLTIAWN